MTSKKPASAIVERFAVVFMCGEKYELAYNEILATRAEADELVEGNIPGACRVARVLIEEPAP